MSTLLTGQSYVLSTTETISSNQDFSAAAVFPNQAQRVVAWPKFMQSLLVCLRPLSAFEALTGYKPVLPY